MSTNDVGHWDISSQHLPTAIYFEESDSVEYVRRDVPCVYRRVDELLTLILEMETRCPVGFQIKGFKYYYLKHVSDPGKSNDFALLINILQSAFTKLGNEVFKENRRLEGYTSALNIADEDRVKTPSLPLFAVS